MPEIASVANGVAEVEFLFKMDTRTNLPDSYLEDYGRRAYFFSDTPTFNNAMEIVSTRLWLAYRQLVSDGEGRGVLPKNLFTTAIRSVARASGWEYSNHEEVVLVGAITAQQYDDWVGSGVFFKDDMDLKHGEHSHTFQWLAVAVAGLPLHHTPTDLYKKSTTILPKGKTVIVPGLKLPGKPKQQGETTDCSLWAWLADCFPSSMGAGQVIPAERSIFSNTYRSPQIVNQYLINTTPKNHFVGEYLRARYSRRSWIDLRAGNKYNSISGASSKDHATSKHKGGDWQPIHGDKGELGAFTRSPGTIQPQPVRPALNQLPKRTFHNVTGSVPFSLKS